MRKAGALTLFAVLSVACGGRSEGHGEAGEPHAAGPHFDEFPYDVFAAPRKGAARGAPTPSQRPAPPTGAPPAKAAPPTAGLGAEGEDLGLRFRDPPWFRKTMFPDATNVNFKRSEADERGLFSSQILFDLPEGTSVDDCTKALEEKVSPMVKNLETTKAGDRSTLKGSTDRYTVTMLCGSVQGVTKAYVSYAWTS